MDNITSIIVAVASPFVAAILTSLLSNRNQRLKEIDAERRKSVKELAGVLFEIQTYCIGVLSREEGNEFSPYWAEESMGLTLRRSLHDCITKNRLALSKADLNELHKIDHFLSAMCNVEMSIATNSWDLDIEFIGLYESCNNEIERLINLLSDDLYRIRFFVFQYRK